nr:MAG TPA: hypothetical protein [Microviridae sp.]
MPLVHWLVMSRCIFCFNSCSLLCDSKTGVTSNPFPPSLVRDWQK